MLLYLIIALLVTETLQSTPMDRRIANVEPRTGINSDNFNNQHEDNEHHAGSPPNRHELELIMKELRTLVTFGNISDDKALSNLVTIVFTRLRVLTRAIDYDRHNLPPHMRPPQNMDDLKDTHDQQLQSIVNCFLLKLKSKYLRDVFSTRSNFFIRLLRASLRPQLLSSNPNNCSQNPESERHSLPRNIMSMVKQMYIRNTQLPTVMKEDNSLLRFNIENTANRLLCVNSRSLYSSNNHNAGDREIAAKIVLFILKDVMQKSECYYKFGLLLRFTDKDFTGYMFIDNEDACPIDYIKQLYSMHAVQEHGNIQLNVNGFQQMLDDVYLNNTVNTLGVKEDSLKETRSAHSWHLHSNHSNHNTQNSGGEREGTQHHANSNLHQNWHYLTSNKDSMLHVDGLFITRNTLWNNHKCRNATELLELFVGPSQEDHMNAASQQQSLNPASPRQPITAARPIDIGVFYDMCPAILYQLLAGDCKQHNLIISTETPIVTTHHTMQTTNPNNDSFTDKVQHNQYLENVEHISDLKRYLYGSISVLVISLFSLFGALFMKLTRGDVQSYIMASMMALAVGCLVADAVLHLFPELMDQDTNDDNDENATGQLLSPAMFKLCTVLASIYGFFVLELIFAKYQTHTHDSNLDNKVVKEVELLYVKSLKESNLNMNNGGVRNTSQEGNKQINIINNIKVEDTHFNEIRGASIEDAASQQLGVTRSLSNVSAVSSVHSNHGASTPKSLAWMIIIGDGIHNFADGLAIGASYSIGFSKGLSTAITVLCHEVPHELGDFAVLISTGMSIKRAMLLNFLSSLTAFAGLFAGLALGSQEEATKWIFAVGAGMFLYVALTDLVPECKDYFKRKPTFKMFLGQNVGLLVGYGSMLLLAMYENRLAIKTEK